MGVLVAQHMPEKFTRAFAERLGHASAFTVAEAADGDLVAAGRVLIAPGGHHLEVRREPGTGIMRAALVVDSPAPLPVSVRWTRYWARISSVISPVRTSPRSWQ
jgi:chemotaxis response regulator CheB